MCTCVQAPRAQQAPQDQSDPRVMQVTLVHEGRKAPRVDQVRDCESVQDVCTHTH